jgi:large subunit ribosomal protein L25
MHPYKQLIMHIDLQRISATDKIHMSIPLHFTGGDEAPGVKIEGGIVSHLITELDIICLPDNLPEFISVDVSDLHLGDSIHLSEITLPEGVESTTLSHGGDDLAVVTVVAVRGSIEEEVTEEAVEEEAAPSEEEAGPEE